MGDDASMANEPSNRSEVEVSEITGFWLRGGQYVEAADNASLPGVTVEIKRLLLAHAFESGARRVVFRVDALNALGANLGCAGRSLVSLAEDDLLAAVLAPECVLLALLVVGGGVAGLECARVAATRGHRVTAELLDQVECVVVRQADEVDVFREHEHHQHADGEDDLVARH